MAVLDSDSGALRFRLDLVEREGRARGAGQALEGHAPAGRLLACAAVEYLDRRDGERWPLVSLPVVGVAQPAAQALADGLGGLLQGSEAGFAWRSGEDAAVGLQLGLADPAAPDALLVEVGMDLGLFLAEVTGTPRRPGAELALFRFPVTRAAAVAFAGALRAELDELVPS